MSWSLHVQKTARSLSVLLHGPSAGCRALDENLNAVALHVGGQPALQVRLPEAPCRPKLEVQPQSFQTFDGPVREVNNVQQIGSQGGCGHGIGLHLHGGASKLSRQGNDNSTKECEGEDYHCQQHNATRTPDAA